MTPWKRPSLLRHAFLGTLLVAGFTSTNADAAAQDAAALVKAGEQLLQKNDAKGAEAQFQQAIQQAPNDASVRIELARVYLKQNNLHAAEAELALVKQKRFLVDKSNYTNVELSEQLDATLSEILYREGESGRLLREVLVGNRKPQLESVVRTYRGLAELGFNQRAAAQTMLQDAERIDPMSLTAKVGTARFLFATGDLAAAERKIDDALKAAPHDSDALNTKGAIVQAAGRRDEALTYFNNAMKENPRNSFALLNRAKLYIANGDLDHAAEDVRLLQDSDTTRWMSIYLHASIAARQHDYKAADEALAKFRPAMDRLPESYLLAGIVKFYLNHFCH
jgi:tetratricopeptide (TPR) repeat protein